MGLNTKKTHFVGSVTNTAHHQRYLGLYVALCNKANGYMLYLGHFYWDPTEKGHRVVGLEI